jgi:hypothetical protein
VLLQVIGRRQSDDTGTDNSHVIVMVIHNATDYLLSRLAPLENCEVIRDTLSRLTAYNCNINVPA